MKTRGGEASGSAGVTALLALLTAALPKVSTGLGLGEETGKQLAAFLTSHSTLLPMLYTANPLTASMPWSLMSAATLLGAANPGLPVLGHLSKAVQAMQITRTGGLAGTISSQVALAAISALFNIDRTLALVALGAAGWTGWLSTLFVSLIGIKGTLSTGVLSFIPMAAASFLAALAMLLFAGSKRGDHGRSLHTLVHAGGIAAACTAVAEMGIAPGFASLLQPATAVGAYKLMQAVV